MAAERPAKDEAELVAIYAEMASTFDRMEPLDRLLTGRYRRRLFSRARGRVLDVACGTGINFRYLPDSVELVAVDLSPDMLERARATAADLGLDAELLRADAADLPFDENAFDTVLSSLSTCTFPDPVATLREMDRVCAPGGEIRLLEHGRSPVRPIARFQDWWAPRHFEKHGCRWNQEPAALVEEAGLEMLDVRRALLGVLTSIVVAPAASRRY